MLKAHEITVGYTEVAIVKSVKLELPESNIGVIVGPNGAGKSTLLKTLFGLLPMQKGTIMWKKNDITKWSPEDRVRNGMAYVPQENNVFTSLTVKENLEMGAYSRSDDFSDTIDKMLKFFPPLKTKYFSKVATLSGGQRQMVAIARALMIEPSLILLDEPTVGLSPKYMQEIFIHIQTIHKAGVGILMVEQNARQALAIADKGFVLASGKNCFTDSGTNLLANPEVVQSFLGY